MAKSALTALLLFNFLLGPVYPPGSEPTATPMPSITAYDIILAVNQGRMGAGLPALLVDSILMGTAQGTADYMAANNMTGHIGDVRGRVKAAGYGGYENAWATENFAMASAPMTVEDLVYGAWGDETHMKPMLGENYTHVGAGIATASDGTIYYVLHAAYTEYGRYRPAEVLTPVGSITPGTPVSLTAVAAAGTEAISQYMLPVIRVTPEPDGKLVHTVRYGQTLWSIAIAYDTKIVKVLELSGLAPDTDMVYTGQKLVVGYAPTPAATVAIEVGIEDMTENNPTVVLPTSPSTQTPGVTSTPSAQAPQPSDQMDDQKLGIGMLVVYAIGLVIVILVGYRGMQKFSS
jgi:hypothetical protein